MVRTVPNRRSATLFVFGLVTSLIGCGKRDPMERLPVYGNVSLASGENVGGSITFVPAEGRSGPAATTSIVDGRYRFDADNGPTEGPSRIIVNRAIAKGALSLETVRDRIAKESAAAEKAAKAKTPAEKAEIQKADDEEAAAYAKQFRTDWVFFVDVAADKSYRHDFTLEQ
jgi:hypothetical protein